MPAVHVKGSAMPWRTHPTRPGITFDAGWDVYVDNVREVGAFIGRSGGRYYAIYDAKEVLVCSVEGREASVSRVAYGLMRRVLADLG